MCARRPLAHGDVSCIDARPGCCTGWLALWLASWPTDWEHLLVPRYHGVSAHAWALTLQQTWFDLLDDHLPPVEPRDACFTSASTCASDLPSRLRARSSELLRRVMPQGLPNWGVSEMRDTVNRWWRGSAGGQPTAHGHGTAVQEKAVTGVR